MAAIQKNRPVLILGEEPRVVVTVARSLHRSGIPVIVVGLSAEEPQPVSHAIRSFIRLSHHREGRDKFLADLSNLIQREDCSMLIPSSDTGLTVVADHYEQLASLLHIGCPPPAIVRQVLDKDQTIQVAQKCGIAIPATYAIHDRAQLEASRSQMQFPVVAKPRSKKDIGTSVFKVRYFQSFEELAAAFATDEKFGARVVLQEYCEGVGVGVSVLMKCGDPVVMFQHRRVTEWPYTGGVGVTVVSEALDPVLAEQAITLLRAIHWEGVAMVEFRKDLVSGRAVLMEVNGRYWGTVSIAVQAGVDFPLYEWQLAHSEAPSLSTKYTTGMKWRWLPGDLMRLHGLLMDERPNHVPRPSRWKEAWRFLLDSGPSTRSALWSSADPQPAISETIRTLKRLLLGDVRRIISSVIPPKTRKAIRFYRNLDPNVRAVYFRQQCLRNLGCWPTGRRKIPDGVHSLMFICHGNIIRSPMAYVLLQRHLAADGVGGVTVSSGGLHTKTGSVADRRAVKVAKEFGVSLDAHTATQLTCESVRSVDVIVVMDYLNEARLLNCCPEVKHKIFMLGAYLRDPAVRSMEISDPYHGTEADIRQCYQMLNRCVAVLYKELTVRAPRT
jgi:predicted ATP-grasp superfamily ATP-dependent carboligase/protein-tyrosine-phosphatase